MTRDDNACSKGTISPIDLRNWPNKITKLGHSLYVQAISVLGGITYLLYNGQLRGPFNGSWNEIFKKHPIPFYYCVGILTPFDLLSNCHSVVKTLLMVHSVCNVMAIWICIYLHCNAWREGLMFWLHPEVGRTYEIELLLICTCFKIHQQRNRLIQIGEVFSDRVIGTSH